MWRIYLHSATFLLVNLNHNMWTHVSLSHPDPNRSSWKEALPLVFGDQGSTTSGVDCEACMLSQRCSAGWRDRKRPGLRRQQCFRRKAQGDGLRLGGQTDARQCWIISNSFESDWSKQLTWLPWLDQSGGHRLRRWVGGGFVVLLIGGWCRCGLGMRGGGVGACRSSLLIGRWEGRLRCGGSIASFGQPWLSSG